MKFALAQINPTVGDIAGNAALIADYYDEAKEKGADLVICPELSLVGYPPEDLILMPAFVKEAMAAAKKLAKKTTRGPALIVGCPWQGGKQKNYRPSSKVPGGPWDEKQQIYNAALFCDRGKIVHVTQKVMLPNYSVFDEKRIFTPGAGPKVIRWRGRKLGILVCEDVWSDRLPKELGKQGADLLIVINASPFEAHKLVRRQEVAARAAKSAGAPLVYVNCIGGQDDIVFDGNSFMLNAKGKVVAQLPEFEEILVILSETKGLKVPHRVWGDNESLWRAMAVGLADYVRKNEFEGVMLGLSGGIDSAAVAALACDAIGAHRVKGVLLPSPYTSKESVRDAEASAKMLGIETMTVPITPGMEIFDEVLSPVFKESGWMKDVAIGGNVQARLRGTTLMAISNKFGWLLLATSNKSEVAVGYTTLYGDSCGGYAPLKDLYKTQVYALAKWRNAVSSLPLEKGGWGGFPVIPERSISRAPTAELAPGQKDQDQLPPYAQLDKILMLHLEGRLSAKEIIARGHPKAIVEKVVKMVRMSEYKRRQSCPGTKLTPMLFGRDRRFPLTNKF